MLKKASIKAAPAAAKKETVPTVAIKAVIVTAPEGAKFIGPVVAETAEKLTVRTDSGDHEFVRNDVTIVPLVGAFKDAKESLESAEAAVKELEPHLKRMGVSQITSHNCNSPLDPWTSVKLEGQDEQKVRVSSTQKYSYVNGDLVSSVFEALGQANVPTEPAALEAHQAKYDVNNYVQETAVAAFDAKFFLDAQGNFCKAHYDAVFAAMEVVAKKLGKVNPLTAKTVVQPKPGFHEKRYAIFSSEENAKIHEVMPNTISISTKVS